MIQLLLRASLFAVLGCLPGYSSAQSPLPANLLNHNLFPPSPEAAALGRFGEVPVSLYTGVPSITIPLMTLPGRTVSVPLSLQYHGGGVRPDQVAPWTGMSWTLNAGGAITRTCRGIDDFAPKGYARNMRPLPLYMTKFCYNGATNGNGADHRNYYEYFKEVYEGRQDTQPDVFSFNFQGYAGKIIFDQSGTPHTMPAQPLKITSPLTSADGSWTLTTPEGTAYTFAATEMTSSEGTGNGQYGASAWYLTSIVTAQQERVDFIYQDYSTDLYYSTVANNLPVMPSMSMQRVLDLNKNPLPGALLCSNDLDVSPRPITFVRGKFLRRIVSATHRIDLLSSTDRLDQPGMRKLHTVRIKYLADSTRYQEFRLQYRYYDGERDRLFLRQVQKVGLEANGREIAEPPYKLTYYSPLFANNGTVWPARGTYSVDRWGFYNAANNRYPFLRDNQQSHQILTATSRETNPAAITFGLLQRVEYPAGGDSRFEFESNDFNNVAGQSYTESAAVLDVCRATAGVIDCGNQTGEATFVLSHAQVVRFETSAYLSNGDADPITELDATGSLEVLNSAGGWEPSADLPYRVGIVPAGQEAVALMLPAGQYRLRALTPSNPRAIQVNVQARYIFRHYTGKKWQGGGTRIKRIITYDGQDHARDHVKDYYYDTNYHTRSTGKLIHQPIFHTTSNFILIGGLDLSGGTPDDEGTVQHTCHYVLHFAEDMAAASGSAQGSAVGYDTVSVIQREDSTSLRSTSVFHNKGAANIDLSDQATELQGFVPVNFDEKNGLLLETADYVVPKNTDPFDTATARLVRRETQQYGNDSIPDIEIMGVSVGGSLGELLEESATACRGVISQTYKTYVGWWPVTQSTETRYSATGQSFATSTRWLYRSSQHYQPYGKEVTGVDGQTQVTRFKYALDYEPMADAGVQQLQEQYCITIPVETQSWVRRPDRSAQWIGGQVIKFTTTAGGAQPDLVFQAALSAPTAAPVEAKSAAGLYTSLLPAPVVYQPRAWFKYSPLGILREQALTRDQPMAYLWGYHNLRPIAEVRNATANEVAYTSFEPESSGSWVYDTGAGEGRVLGQSRTGNWAFQLQAGAVVTRANLPTNQYILTF